MRVLFVTNYYHPATEWGGPAHSVPLTAKCVAEAGAQVSVVTTTTRRLSDLPELDVGTREVFGVPVTYHRAKGPRGYFYSPDLAADVRRRLSDVDLVHVQTPWTFPPLAASRACRAVGVPYLLAPRGQLDRWSLSQKSLKKRAYLALVGMGVLEGAVAIQYTAPGEREATLPSIGALPAVVVPNPIELGDLLAVPAPEPTPGLLRLVISGRIHKKKGFDVLVPALSRVAEAGHDVRLVVVGGDEGGYQAEVERMAAEAGVGDRIEFVGHLDRAGLVARLAEADVAVMPSYQENFGMAAAEAMAAGRPVIASNAVNIADAIAEAGAGLVTGVDVGELAAAISSLAEAPARIAELGARGRQLVRERYHPTAVGARMLQVYEDVLAGRVC